MVLAPRGNSRLKGGGDVDEMSWVAGSGHVGVADAGTGRPGLGEYPLVGGITAGIQRGEPDRAMIGVVDRALIAPGEVET